MGDIILIIVLSVSTWIILKLFSSETYPNTIPDENVETFDHLVYKIVNVLGTKCARVMQVCSVDNDFAKDKEKDSWVIGYEYYDDQGVLREPWIFVNVSADCEQRKKDSKDKELDMDVDGLCLVKEKKSVWWGLQSKTIFSLKEI